MIVNRGDFGGDAELQRHYASFVRANNLASDGGVRLVPVSGKDLADALLKLSKRHPEAGMRFSSEALFNCFDQIISELLLPKPRSGPGWMAKLLVRCALDDWGWGGGGSAPPSPAARRRPSGPGPH